MGDASLLRAKEVYLINKLSIKAFIQWITFRPMTLCVFSLAQVVTLKLYVFQLHILRKLNALTFYST